MLVNLVSDNLRKDIICIVSLVVLMTLENKYSALAVAELFFGFTTWI